MSEFDLKNFRGVGFDFDGVLAKSPESHTLARRQAYVSLAAELDDPRLIIDPAIHAEGHNHGNDPESINAWILSQAGLIEAPEMKEHQLVTRIVELKNQNFREICAKGHDEIPGAANFVRKVTSRKPSKEGIGTTAYKWEVTPFLIRHGLMAYFPDRRVISRDDTDKVGGQRKPDPKVYHMLIDAIGIKDPADCLVVEDTERGIESGKRAGATVIAIATSFDLDYLASLEGYQKPDAIVQDYAELSSLVL